MQSSDVEGMVTGTTPAIGQGPSPETHSQQRHHNDNVPDTVHNENIHSNSMETTWCMDEMSPSFIAEYKAKLRFWLHFVKYPLIWIIVNVAVYGCIFAYVGHTHDTTPASDSVIVVQYMLGTYSVLCFINVLIIYHYAITTLEAQTIQSPRLGVSNTCTGSIYDVSDGLAIIDRFWDSRMSLFRYVCTSIFIPIPTLLFT